MGLKQIGLLRAKLRARFIKHEQGIFFILQNSSFFFLLEDLILQQLFSLVMVVLISG